MEKVYLGFGSNIHERREYIRKAYQALSEHESIVLLLTSSFYQSRPYGEAAEEQSAYINSAACIETSLAPLELLAVLKSIEAALGRKPRERWGMREIDIDILLYGNRCFESETLIIPHPEMAKRDFVLLPLLEIAPDLFHPNLNQKISDIYKNISEHYIFERIS